MSEQLEYKKEQTKILIIDDDPLDRELLRMMLEKNEFSVIELDNTTSFLDVIEAEKPNLVLLDIMMPGQDGNQVLQMIRTKCSEIKLPVIMVTSKSDASDVVTSLKLGANDYLKKPIQFDVALRRIQIHLTMVAQSKLISHAKELEATHAMIRSFAHEINNPLTNALGILNEFSAKYGADPKFPKLEDNLWRIADVIKKADVILQKTKVTYEEYVTNSKMVKLKEEK